MIKGGYYLAKVKPERTILPNVAYSANDVMFDWHRFEIPRGACAVKSLHVVHPGKDAAAVAGLDIELLFATSVNGVAPPTLGSAHDAITVINATACKNHMIGHKYLDASVLENSDLLVGYNVWSQTSGQSVGYDQIDMVIEGDPTYPGTTTGYQSVWMAVITIGTADFGTNVLLDGAVTDLTTRAFDVANDADADDVFAVGDDLLACANDGSSVQAIGKVVSLTADEITTDGVGFDGALADDDEISFKAPLTFNIGLEY